jgi:hypothetical protein
MKNKISLLILSLLISASAPAQSILTADGLAALSGATPPVVVGSGVILSEDFESWPSSWTYSGTQGTASVNEWNLQLTTSVAPASTITNFDSTGLSMQGNFVLKMSDPGGDFPSVTLATNLTAYDEVWAFFRFRTTALAPAGSGKGYFELLNGSSGGAIVCSINLGAGNTLEITDGSASADTVASISANTTYWLWLHYKISTSDNGIAEIGFSTDGTKPTSGNSFASITTGTDTDQAIAIRMTPPASAGGPAYWDTIRFDNHPIGSNPP